MDDSPRANEVDVTVTIRTWIGEIVGHLDVLQKIGYFTNEQRNFVERVLWKYPTALAVMEKTKWAETAKAGLHTAMSSDRIADLSVMKPILQNSMTSVRAHPLSQVTAANNIGARQSKQSEMALNIFLKRCDQLKVSAKVAAETGEHGDTNDLAHRPRSFSLSSIPTATIMSKPGARLSATDTQRENFAIANSVPALNPPEVSEHTNIADEVPHGSTHNVELGLSVPSLLLRPSEVPLSQRPDEFQKFEPKGANTMECDGTSLMNADEGIEDLLVEKRCHKPIQFVKKLGESHSGSIDFSSMVNIEALVSDLLHGPIISKPDKESIHEPVAASQATNAWGRNVSSKCYNNEGDVVGGEQNSFGASFRGRAMLEKMGWSEGTGLGANRTGILEPPKQTIKTSKKGLGANTFPVRVPTPEIDDTWTTPKDTPLNNSGGRSDWDKSPALNEESLKGLSDTQPTIKARVVSKKDTTRKIGKAHGITALFIQEGSKVDLSGRDIYLHSYITTLNQRKTTRHYAGIKLEACQSQNAATRPQGSPYLAINIGDHLEVTKPEQNGFVADNLRTGLTGFLRIHSVRMGREPDYSLDNEVYGEWFDPPTTLTTTSLTTASDGENLPPPSKEVANSAGKLGSLGRAGYFHESAIGMENQAKGQPLQPTPRHLENPHNNTQPVSQTTSKPKYPPGYIFPHMRLPVYEPDTFTEGQSASNSPTIQTPPRYIAEAIKALRSKTTPILTETIQPSESLEPSIATSTATSFDPKGELNPTANSIVGQTEDIDDTTKPMDISDRTKANTSQISSPGGNLTRSQGSQLFPLNPAAISLRSRSENMTTRNNAENTRGK